MSTAELFGQADRGVIRGSVTDVTGAVVPGARITATRVSTNTRFNTTSTATSDYTIPTLQAGEYSLNVEADGFKSFTRTNIFVIAGGSATGSPAVDTGGEDCFAGPDQRGRPRPRGDCDVGAVER